MCRLTCINFRFLVLHYSQLIAIHSVHFCVFLPSGTIQP